MKRLLLALALLASSAALSAQTYTVPLNISYHGRVTDANGNLIGGSGGPVNRKIQFRIYNHKSASLAANKLYTEEQMVTIANGEFSVLIGSGTTPINGEANATTFDLTFNPANAVGAAGIERYIGISVADANGAMSAEISPRQQIVTTAFAMRAKVAEGLANPITATQLADATITGAKIVNNTITNVQIASGTITNSQIASGTIGATQIADGAITAAKLAPGVGATTTYTSPITITTGDTRTDIAEYNEQLVLRSSVDDRMRLALSADVVGGTGFSQIQSHHAAVIWAPLKLNPKGGKVVVGDPGASVMTNSGGFDVYGTVNVVNHGVGGTGNLNVGNNLSVTGSITGSLNGSNIVGGSISADKLNFTPLTSVPANSVGWSQIIDGSVDYPDLATGAVTNPKIAAGAITADKFATSGFGYPTFPDGARANIGLNVNHGGTAGITMTVQANASDSTLLYGRNSAGLQIFGVDKFGSVFSATGVYTNFSDRRLKHNIQSLTGTLDRLLKLRSVTYEWNKPEQFGTGTRAGFIAQEVEEVYPEWITTGEDGYKRLGFVGFEANAVQAIRELRAEKDAQLKERDATIATLEQNVAAMKSEATATAARLAQLEKTLAKLSEHAGD